MSGETGHRFLCPGCGASFGWKPQYGGRKIRCKCGQVFVPPDPASVASAEEPDPYAVNDDLPVSPPPSRRTAPRHAAPVAGPRVTPGHAAPLHASAAGPVAVPGGGDGVGPSALAGVAALYPTRRARPVQEDADGGAEGSVLKDVYVPVALLVLGLGLRVGQLLATNELRGNKWGGDVATPDDPRKAVLLALFQMIISAGVMIAGATLAATILSLNLGSLGKAALKLCAMAVFATGVASWAAVFDQDQHSVRGLVLALHVVVILYWVGFTFLFALDLQETLLAVSIITLMHAAATCALWKA